MGRFIRISRLIWAAIISLTLICSFSCPIQADTEHGEVDLTTTVPLTISDVSASSIGYYGATISWKTNGDATSQVFYDTEFHDNIALYADDTEDITPVSEHSVRLTGLSSGTTYHYRVRSATIIEGSDFIAISGNYTFRTLSPPAPGPGPAPRYYVDTSLFGVEEEFRTSLSGEVLKPIEATSEDGMLTLTIPEGTIALDKDGKRLKDLQAAVDESPPEAPKAAHIIGLAYDFGPDGATFDPPITLEYTYDPGALPEGVAPEDLVIAYWDGDEWVELVCVVDTVNNTITASVDHFTTFAIIGAVTPPPAVFAVSSLSISPATVNIGETVTISLVVTNTGGKSGSYIVTLDINGVKEADETVTVAAGDSQEVSFSVTKEDAGIYSVTVAELTGSFTVVAPAAFSVSDLSLQPAQVKPGEAVTISASVANTGGEPGSYTVVLKIDGVKEAEKTVTIAAGESLDVSFSVTKEEADTYTVTVDGLSGSFTVAPAEPLVNWPLIGGIIGGVIAVALLVFFLVRRRA